MGWVKLLSIKELEKYESFNNWMASLPGEIKPQTTKYTWALKLKVFCDWIGKNPDELIEERKRQLKSDDPQVQHKMEVEVKKFMRYLESKGLSSSTRRTYFTAIRNFFAKNYLPLTFFRGEGPKVEPVLEGCRAATHTDLKRMLDVANLREKALIVFMAHTGIAEADVVRLKVGDLGKVLGIRNVAQNLEKLEPPIPIELRRKKTKILQRTFVSSEAWDLLKAYLEMRMRGVYRSEMGVKKGFYHSYTVPPENLTDDSPLFRSYGKWGKGRKPLVTFLTPHAVSVIVRRVARKAGIWVPGFSAHSLRRFFQTTLELVGVPPNWIKIMMGHKRPGEEAPYSRPTWEMLRNAYIQAEPYLRVTFSQEDIKKLREDLENFKKRYERNGEVKDALIRQLQAQVEELRRELERTRPEYRIREEVLKVLKEHGLLVKE